MTARKRDIFVVVAIFLLAFMVITPKVRADEHKEDQKTKEEASLLPFLAPFMDPFYFDPKGTSTEATTTSPNATSSREDVSNEDDEKSEDEKDAATSTTSTPGLITDDPADEDGEPTPLTPDPDAAAEEEEDNIPSLNTVSSIALVSPFSKTFTSSYTYDDMRGFSEEKTRELATLALILGSFGLFFVSGLAETAGEKFFGRRHKMATKSIPTVLPD